MNILAFDTCLDACSVAAGRGLRSLTPSISSVFEPMPSGQAERLVPAIEFVMRDAGLAFRELDRVVVTIGPGTFTGARIAVSAARALALASSTPIVALTSLELMALSPRIPAARGRRFAIATDARRGEVYMQVFDRRTSAAITDPSAMTVEEAAAAVMAVGADVVAGSGAEAVAERGLKFGAEIVAILPNLLPDALDVLFASLTYSTRRTISPLYLRPPDAKPPEAVLKARVAACP